MILAEPSGLIQTSDKDRTSYGTGHGSHILDCLWILVVPKGKHIRFDCYDMQTKHNK